MKFFKLNDRQNMPDGWVLKAGFRHLLTHKRKLSRKNDEMTNWPKISFELASEGAMLQGKKLRNQWRTTQAVFQFLKRSIKRLFPSFTKQRKKARKKKEPRPTSDERDMYESVKTNDRWSSLVKKEIPKNLFRHRQVWAIFRKNGEAQTG